MPIFPTGGPWARDFLAFMAQAIGTEWRAVTGTKRGDLAAVQTDLPSILSWSIIVWRDQRLLPILSRASTCTIRSGEFDALSYAFYKSAFETFSATIADTTAMADAAMALHSVLASLFINQLHEHLALRLPNQLQTEADFTHLQKAIDRAGR